jgi:peptide deformylase
MVPRARLVRVRALNEIGEPVQVEAEGWYARILQHEIDHLQRGVVYRPHVEPELLFDRTPQSVFETKIDS